MQDREVDRLQDRQRARIDRVNRARAQNVHPDLQDLAFGSTAGSGGSLPAPIAPRDADDDYRHGGLSDYSDDYSSSDSDYYAPRGTGAAGPSTGSGTGSQPATNARSYAQFIQQDDERTGKGKGLLAEPEEDDPFADPEDGASLYSVQTPGINQDKRMDWREV